MQTPAHSTADSPAASVKSFRRIGGLLTAPGGGARRRGRDAAFPDASCRNSLHSLVNPPRNSDFAEAALGERDALHVPVEVQHVPPVALPRVIEHVGAVVG